MKKVFIHILISFLFINLFSCKTYETPEFSVKTSLNSVDSGTIQVYNTTPAFGDMVKFKVTPKTHYYINSITVKLDGYDTSINYYKDVEPNTYYYFATGDTKISVSFYQYHNINVIKNNTDYKFTKISPTSYIYPGDTVTYKIEPQSSSQYYADVTTCKITQDNKIISYTSDETNKTITFNIPLNNNSSTIYIDINTVFQINITSDKYIEESKPLILNITDYSNTNDVQYDVRIDNATTSNYVTSQDKKLSINIDSLSKEEHSVYIQNLYTSNTIKFRTVSSDIYQLLQNDYKYISYSQDGYYITNYSDFRKISFNSSLYNKLPRLYIHYYYDNDTANTKTVILAGSSNSYFTISSLPKDKSITFWIEDPQLKYISEKTVIPVSTAN